MEETAKVGMSRQNNRGFTLVELMVAMLITLVGLVGLLQAVNMAMEHNLRNQLRDEAVLIGEQWMGNLKSRGFSRISTPFNAPKQVPSQLRGGNFSFTVRRPCESTGASAKTLKVKVDWTYKGIGYTHQVSSIRSEE